MFKKAAPKPGPLPDEETCVNLAKAFSGWMPKEMHRRLHEHYQPYEMTNSEASYREKFKEAIKVLRAAQSHENSFPGCIDFQKSILELEVMLGRAEKLFDCKPRLNPHPQLKTWAITAFWVSNLVDEALKDCGRRPTIVSRNTVAAKVTALVLARIGWRDEQGGTINPATIANNHRRFMAD